MTPAGVYSGLLRLYPRDFRLQYGDDMRQLLELQLRDEHVLRVFGRTLLDLALTVPSLRLESLMSRRRQRPGAFVLYGAACVASLVLTAMSGSALGVGTAGLLLAVVFGSLAVVAWRRGRALHGGSGVSSNGLRYVAAGGLGIAACVLVANLGGDELPGNTWFVWMLALLTSMVLMAVGLMLGLMYALATRRTASS